MELHGRITEVGQLTEQDKQAMFLLMAEFYDDTAFPVFIRDLSEKDYCILLYDASNIIQGFSTQKIMAVDVGGAPVYGVFSGDTIIHKDYWGSMELFRVFARFYIDYGKRYENFYWFLISKGYKTYKMLPVFFNEFYPNYRTVTPPHEQAIIAAFGRQKYPDEFDPQSGVIFYKGVKDKLKAGVADITAKQLRDKDIVHFLQLNPGHQKGYDLVCLTRLTEDNFKPAAQKLLLGK
jgi:hypothetical protein